MKMPCALTGNATRDTHLEVHSARVAVHIPQQRRSKAEVHGERCNSWLYTAQAAYCPDRQCLERHVASTAREIQHSLAAIAGGEA